MIPEGEILMGINPLLIGLGLQTGLGLLEGRSAEKQRKKQQAEQNRKSAFSTLVGSLGGNTPARASQQAPQPGNPLLGAATQLSSDPLVQQQLTKLLERLLSGGGGLLGRLPR